MRDAELCSIKQEKNMGIPLFGEIERLITEHGSATVLSERLALAKDQYSSLEKENLVLKTENDRLRLDNDQLKERLRILDQHQNISLVRKYGIFWDSEGTPYCPHCQKSGMSVKWATYINRQIKALQCACTQSPFILMDAGNPIQADEAMKIMAKQISANQPS